MRFNHRITFVIETEGGFDPDKGEHVKGQLEKVTKPCRVSALKVDRQRELFGEVDSKVFVVRLQHPYMSTFDYVLINDKKYHVRGRSDYRKGALFVERSGGT